MRRRYLTVKEVADFLCVSTKTIYRLARAARIPSYKFGGQWRFPYGEIVHLNLARFREYARQRVVQLRQHPAQPPRGYSLLERMLRWAVVRMGQDQPQPVPSCPIPPSDPPR